MGQGAWGACCDPLGLARDYSVATRGGPGPDWVATARAGPSGPARARSTVDHELVRTRGI